MSFFCRMLSEFALEYRTTKEKVTQTREKKASQKERSKTRGKMITEVRHEIMFGKKYFDVIIQSPSLAAFMNAS